LGSCTQQITLTAASNYQVKSSQLHSENDHSVGWFNKLGIFNVLRIVSPTSRLQNSKRHQNPIV
jgi:hypothetical protein